MIDLTHRTFGRWKVLSRIKGRKHICQCACGSPPRPVRNRTLLDGSSKSCGCLQIESVSKRPYESLYHRLLTHNSDMPVDLSYEEYLEFTHTSYCHYCFSKITWESSGRRSTAYNLDRKDNSLGYSKKNCVVCCGSCNRTKGDRFTYAEFMLIAKVIRRINRMRQGVL
jgi:hypothetical protein